MQTGLWNALCEIFWTSPEPDEIVSMLGNSGASGFCNCFQFMELLPVLCSVERGNIPVSDLDL